MFKLDQDITLADGTEWRILNIGAEDDDEVILHLASKAEGRMQKNGFVHCQSMGWVNKETLELRRCN